MSRVRLCADYDDNRYVPRHMSDGFNAPPPDLAATSGAPATRSSGSFVRGGQLETVVEGGGHSGRDGQGTNQAPISSPRYSDAGNTALLRQAQQVITLL